MRNRLECVQQLEACIWSITSQLVDDCELIISHLREVTRNSQVDSSRGTFDSPQADGSTTAVASTPLTAGKKRLFTAVNELRLPELEGSKSLLQKYTVSGADRTKRVCMIETKKPLRCRTSTPIKFHSGSREEDPFSSPSFATTSKRRIPKAIASDTDSF